MQHCKGLPDFHGHPAYTLTMNSWGKKQNRSILLEKIFCGCCDFNYRYATCHYKYTMGVTIYMLHPSEWFCSCPTVIYRPFTTINIWIGADKSLAFTTSSISRKI